MQSKPTKQTPAPSAAERRFMAYTKDSDCICCGNPGPSIVDHIWGKSKKLYNGPERVHVGHWAVIPLCVPCDNVKTRGSRRAFEDQFYSQVTMWFLHAIRNYGKENIPESVRQAMIAEETGEPHNG